MTACGLRRSEVLGLEWSAVDWESGSVEVRQGRVKTLAADDELTIVLVEPEITDMPSSVVVHWPPAPSVSDPGRFPELASSVVKLFAAAATKLAHIKSRRAL